MEQASPAVSAALTASIPSYAKQVTSMSASRRTNQSQMLECNNFETLTRAEPHWLRRETAPNVGKDLPPDCFRHFNPLEHLLRFPGDGKKQ